MVILIVTGTCAETRLQGHYYFKDYFWGFKNFLKNFWGCKTTKRYSSTIPTESEIDGEVSSIIVAASWLPMKEPLVRVFLQRNRI